MLQYEIKGLDKILKKTSPRILAQPLKVFWRNVTGTIRQNVVGHVPKWTGGLQQEVVTKVDDAPVPQWGKVGYLNAQPGSSVWFQARAMEWGTGSQGDRSVSHTAWHQPPGAALDPWAKAHGFESGWQVANAIGKKGGLKGHLSLKLGFKQSVSTIRGFIGRLKSDIAATWNR